MLQSQLFTKTRKEAPKDEVSKNAQLLIRAGFVHKEMAGAYSFLPLGLRVLNKIQNIIREEMNAIGGQEMYMTALQPKELWEKTNRWSDQVIDVWFKTKLKNQTEVGLGTTHEEMITNIMSEYVHSYRDLPFAAYQFQTKFRNETRAKSGLIRGREFSMKDMYSFSRTQEEHVAFYEKAKQAYLAVFKRLGLGDKTYVTYASGGSFSATSDEFQTLSEAGEDVIYVCDTCKISINEEMIATIKVCPTCGNTELRKEKAVEVGNIFNLGTKFSEPLDLTFIDERGDKKPVIMGCYGVGPSRALGTIVEVFADEKGIVWPASVAPFTVHLIELPSEKPEVKAYAQALCVELEKAGIETLHDDRDARAGEKFADSDLIGIPVRITVSEKMVVANTIEVKLRKSGEVKIMPREGAGEAIALIVKEV
ncbi:MAG: aminoacyl--tRNA ligase-related protein [Candidatus Paceibacterota bacterium]|jgi:prolyl-tRNA synthetase